MQNGKNLRCQYDNLNNISERQVGFISVILKIATFHFVSAVAVAVKKISGHIAAFISFLPTEGEDIFAATKKGFE